MVERVLFAPGGATEAKQDTILTSLAALLTELNQKLETGGEVALNAATLGGAGVDYSDHREPPF